MASGLSATCSASLEVYPIVNDGSRLGPSAEVSPTDPPEWNAARRSLYLGELRDTASSSLAKLNERMEDMKEASDKYTQACSAIDPYWVDGHAPTPEQIVLIEVKRKAYNKYNKAIRAYEIALKRHNTHVESYTDFARACMNIPSR